MNMTPFDVAVAAIVFGTVSSTVITLARMKMKAAEQNRMADPDVQHRLERIEQAVDAIAVEVERMAESQRFTTRLLSERMPQSEALPGAERGSR
jgi:hypothetical protein